MEYLNHDNVAKHVSQVTQVLPSFVVENHQKFTEFIKAYYKWSSSQGPAAAMNYLKINNDIDYVSDDMLGGYSELFAKNIPTEMKGDYRFFLKFLKHLYSIRGTEESYKILYRALFDEDVKIHYPRRNLFKTSNAIWAADSYFLMQYDGEPFELRGKKLRGENHGYTCIVSDVLKQSGNLVIIYQDATGKFEPNERIDIEETPNYGTITPVFAIKSFNTKARYYDGDIIKVSENLTLKVDKINYGTILSIDIVDGGAGYKIGDRITTESSHSGTGFNARVNSIGPNGEITSLTIERTGFGYVNANVWFVGGSGSGFNATPIFNPEFRTIKSLSIVSNKPKTTPGIVTHYFGDGETVEFEDGVYTAPKYWKLLSGCLSTETARLHDSNYYQEYSYVLSSIANVSQHEQAIKKALQIAGLKMFVEQTVSDVIEYEPISDVIIEVT